VAVLAVVCRARPRLICPRAVVDPDTLTMERQPDLPVSGASPADLEPARAAVRARRRSAAIGVASVAASAICFGTLPIFARYAYASGVDTATLLLLRFTIAAAIMWTVLLARRLAVPRGRALVALVGMGAIGYAGQAFSFFTAVRIGSVGLASLLLYLYPALVAILSRVFLKHRLVPLQVVAIGMSLAGSVLTTGTGGDGPPAAILFGLLAALIYSVYILTGGRLPASVTPTASTAVVASAAAVVFAAVALAGGLHLPQTAAGWGAVAAIAVVNTVLAVALFLVGVQRLGPVRASVYSTLEPATTLVLAAVLLGEQVTPLRVVGGALILGAVVLLARGEAAAR
jgi:drug/metabolite transporter (DMT)-like permease